MRRIVLAATALVAAFTLPAAAWPPVCKPAFLYELTGICL